MFDKVNLEKALVTEREGKRKSSSSQVLDQFKGLFRAEWENDTRILETISKGCISAELPSHEGLDEHRIFDLNSIRNLCIKYRLRFLSTKQFKGRIPRETFAEIKATEKIVGKRLDAFMVAAPASLFQLEDSNKDPLLFAPLQDGRFYLIHQWGKDLVWYRKLINWPLTSPLTLLTTIIGIGFLITSLIPTSLLSTNGDFFNFMRIVALGWIVVFLLGIASYFWFTSHGKFSIHAWNSKTFN